ncbi:hypothetical protein M758_6G028900 [Ceratodon purpureus]|nr:hypothetical protein M758_6G028900 [Ceratodon purpureus]KAG0612451.1 hypothetical protein M758_6G028900 [Ceratodon purpureus]
MVGARYAPADPTLPQPWRALIDGNNGNIYYWNPTTNVTQYDRPSPPGGSVAPPPSVVSRPNSQGSAQASGIQNGSFSANSAGYGSSAMGTGSAGGQRHSGAGTYDDSNGDGSAAKRPRMEAYAKASPAEVEAYRKKHEVTVMGEDVPAPFMSFEAAGFPPEVLKELLKAGFQAPSPIQAQSWPIVMQQKDVVAVAKTGSGKTLGYLVPSFIHLQNHKNNSRMGPTVLVLAPTRELATQIEDECVKFTKSSKISSTCLYGGAPKGPQIRDIERGADIVIATPGRLNDLLETKKVSLGQVSYLVLDEADRMLDMGFEPQIRKILKEIPPKRQTLMYTATWPKEVRKMAGDFLKNPVQVNIGNTDLLTANKSITQHVEMVPHYEKQRRAEQIIRSQEPGSRIIIFCSTKRMCDTLSRNLGRDFGAAAIHGDKTQQERESVLSLFKNGKAPILVATDVAARGLDVKDVRVVINYDFPTGIEDYVHRIGRTGRAGATGTAYTFFSKDKDGKYAKGLIKILEGANQEVIPELREMASGGGYGGGGSYGGRSSF